MRRTTRLAVVSVLFASASCFAEVRTYDFDDGSLQGWNYTNLDGDPFVIDEDESLVGWSVSIDEIDAGGGEGFNVLQGSSVAGLGAVGTPQRIPNHRVVPIPFSNRDEAGLSQVLRSPFFRLDDSGPISVDIMGGQAQGARSFDRDSDTPPEFFEDHDFTRSGSGWQGFGLYDIADDSYVAWGFPSFNNDGKERDGRDVWERVTISQEDLADFAGDGRYYRLDIFDSYAGSWGWIGFDTAQIPQQEVPVEWDGGDGEWNDANWNGGMTPDEVVGRMDGSNGAGSPNGGETFIIGGGATLSYDANAIGSDFRIKQGSNLIIHEGATWVQATDATWSENRWTEMDLSRLEIDGGTFSRTGVVPGEGGGALIFGSWRGDDNFGTVNGQNATPGRVLGQTTSISLTNGGRLENEGQLWFGGWEDHPPGLTVGMTIDGGTVDLTGGDVEGVGDEADADLVFTYGLDDMGESKNENYSINFTGPGSITVDSSGIVVPIKDPNDGWTGLDPVTYEELWDMGILQAFGQSGATEASFEEFFSVTGSLGADDYTLMSLIGDGVTLVGDCNGDGVLDATDLNCIATIEERDSVLGAIETLPGDLDGDGDVAFADFLTLSANFGQPGTYAEGNVDLSDDISFADFLTLSANFGNTPTTAAVPEPCGLVLSSLLLLSCGCLRRR